MKVYREDEPTPDGEGENQTSQALSPCGHVMCLCYLNEGDPEHRGERGDD